MKSKATGHSVKQPAAIDWKAIHKHLESAQTALETGATVKSAEKTKILKSRAKEVAREPQKESLQQEYLEVLEFNLTYETYGIESAYVREIFALTEITPLPGIPSFILGIVNVRGQILSIIDLKSFFELPDKGLTDLNKIIIIQNENMEFGILADEISFIRRIPLKEIQTSLPTLTGIRQDYLKGVTKEQTLILDAEKLLSDENIIISKKGETK